MSLNFFIFQKNTIVGDLENNFIDIKKSYLESVDKNCDFFLTPELCLSGYPPKDLLFREDFIEKIDIHYKKIVNLTFNKKTTIVLSTPKIKNNYIYNTLSIIENGKTKKEFEKSILPNYGVFDEKRYFKESLISDSYLEFKKYKIKFFICEDLWSDTFSKQIIENKYDLLITINASPYEKNKFEKRLAITKKRVETFKAPLIYVNLVGGQDDLIFDGGSFCMDKDKNIIFQAPFFKDYKNNFILKKTKKIQKIKKRDKYKDLYTALVLGLKDYVKKTGFSSIILGVSGGIDSALSAVIACDAVGPGRVKGFFLPSNFTSRESRDDSINLAKKLGINLDSISIETLRKKFDEVLIDQFKDFSRDVTEENIQSRIRGNLLMSLSNKFNYLLLTTGNKSELSVGYSTIYGDMCGGFSILKDIYKTEVFELCQWRNNNLSDISLLKKLELIPQNIIVKEPTAELRENQKDSDSLLPYDILDKILYLLIDQNMSLKKIEKKGFNKTDIKNLWKMITSSEYKRFQSSLGPKVSGMNFDNDRRFPIVNKFQI